MLIIVSSVIVGLLVFAILIMEIVAWRKTLRIWNDGTCDASGQRWQVFDINGYIYLDDYYKHRVRLGGAVVPSVILEALKQQRRMGRI